MASCCCSSALRSRMRGAKAAIGVGRRGSMRLPLGSRSCAAWLARTASSSDGHLRGRARHGMQSDVWKEALWKGALWKGRRCEGESFCQTAHLCRPSRSRPWSGSTTNHHSISEVVRVP